MASSRNLRLLPVFYILLISMTSVGCTGAMNKKMSSWVGHNYGELMASWGPPQQVYDDGTGGRILVYTANRSYTAPGRATTTSNYNFQTYDNLIWGRSTSRTTYIPPQTYGYTAWRMFWIGRNGRVYNWQWKGL